MLTITNEQALKLAEKSLQAVLDVVGPHGLAIALNNISSHAEGFGHAEIEVTDEQLSEWFKGIEILKAIGAAIEEENGY